MSVTEKKKHFKLSLQFLYRGVKMNAMLVSSSPGGTTVIKMTSMLFRATFLHDFNEHFLNPKKERK